MRSSADAGATPNRYRGGKFAEHFPCGLEQHRMTLNERLMGDVLRKRRFAHSVWANEHGVSCLPDELQRHQFTDGHAIDAFGPLPVEVAQRLEVTQLRGADAPLQGSV